MLLSLALLTSLGAAPAFGAAPGAFQGKRHPKPAPAERIARPKPTADESIAPATFKVPEPAKFADIEGRGLIVEVWLNTIGPFRFAIDTGAGATLISKHAAEQGQLEVTDRPVDLRGLSAASSVEAHDAIAPKIAVGAPTNFLPAQGETIVIGNLPEGVDGILDPTEAYSPLGFVLDMPAHEIRGFDPATSPLTASDAPIGGTIVKWVVQDDSRRPYVELPDGRRALIDSGSRFGFAISEETARQLNLRFDEVLKQGRVNDLGGGEVMARRIPPVTVRLGSLTLHDVPTDMLSGIATDAPILLGRDVLRPFQLTFDPRSKLIRFAPKK
jgi:hypothetical protein